MENQEFGQMEQTEQSIGLESTIHTSRSEQNALVEFYQLTKKFKELMSEETNDREEISKFAIGIMDRTEIIFEEFGHCNCPEEYKQTFANLGNVIGNILSEKREKYKSLSNETKSKDFINNLYLEYLISKLLEICIEFCSLYPVYHSLLAHPSNKDFKTIIWEENDFCNNIVEIIKTLKANDTLLDILVHFLESFVHFNISCINAYKENIDSMTKIKNNSIQCGAVNEKKRLNIVMYNMMGMGFVGLCVGSPFGMPIVGAMIGAGAGLIYFHAAEYFWS